MLLTLAGEHAAEPHREMALQQVLQIETTKQYAD
ncbi:hypothetical protein P606_13380 [Comamonas thiooxydans]|nr:hypothetical protein P606_13380 [Comamonas thiooxydans]